MLVDSLTSGRTKSCASAACKSYKRPGKEKGYTPKPPRACTPKTVKAAWDRYYHPTLARRRTMLQLSERYGVNTNTLTQIFRNVRRCGGVDAYMKAVGK